MAAAGNVLVSKFVFEKINIVGQLLNLHLLVARSRRTDGIGARSKRTLFDVCCC
jgi:hypothetical protein